MKHPKFIEAMKFFSDSPDRKGEWTTYAEAYEFTAILLFCILMPIAVVIYSLI